jgi:hypothetical protein
LPVISPASNCSEQARYSVGKIIEKEIGRKAYYADGKKETG